MGEHLQGAENPGQVLGTYIQPNNQFGHPWNDWTAPGTGQQVALDPLPDSLDDWSFLSQSDNEGPAAFPDLAQLSQTRRSSDSTYNSSIVDQGIHATGTGPGDWMHFDAASAAQPSHQEPSAGENVGSPPQDQCSSGMHYQDPTPPSHTIPGNTFLPAIPEAGAFAGTFNAQSLAVIRKSTEDIAKSALKQFERDRNFPDLVHTLASLFPWGIYSDEENDILSDLMRDLRASLCTHTSYPADLAQNPLLYSEDLAKIALARAANPYREKARLRDAEIAAHQLWMRLNVRSETDQAIGWPLCPKFLGVLDALRELPMSGSGPNPGNPSAGEDSAGDGFDVQKYLTDGSPSPGDQDGDSKTAPQDHAPPGGNAFGRRVSASGAQGGSSKDNEAGRGSLPSVSSSAGDVEGDGPSETGATREQEGERCAIGAPLEEGVGNNPAAVAGPETAAADVSADEGETSVAGPETSAADVSADEGETSVAGPETSAADVTADEGETSVAGPETSAADVSADEGETSETETEDEWDLLEDLADILRKPGIGAGTPSRLEPTKPKGSDEPFKGKDSGDKWGFVRTIELTEPEKKAWRKDIEGYGFKYRPTGSRTKYHYYPFMDGKGNYYRSYDEACDEADRRRGPGAKKVPRAGAYKQVS